MEEPEPDSYTKITLCSWNINGFSKWKRNHSDIIALMKHEVQLGPRYEGQLNPMAEPIPHEVRPLVRTHVYHPYQARTDRQRPIVVFNRRGRVFAPFCGCSLKSRECYNHGPRMASS